MTENQDNRPRQQPLAEQMTKAQIRTLRRLIPRTNDLRRAVIISVYGQIWQPHGYANPGEPLGFGDVVDLVLAEENAGGVIVAAQRDQAGNLIRLKREEGGFAVALGGTETKNKTGGDYFQTILHALLVWFHHLKELFFILGVCVEARRNKDGGFEVSISLVFKNQRDAEVFAMSYDQEVIIDIARGVTINTGGEGMTRWIPPGYYPMRGSAPRPGSQNGVSS